MSSPTPPGTVLGPGRPEDAGSLPPRPVLSLSSWLPRRSLAHLLLGTLQGPRDPGMQALASRQLATEERACERRQLQARALALLLSVLGPGLRLPTVRWGLLAGLSRGPGLARSRQASQAHVRSGAGPLAQTPGRGDRKPWARQDGSLAASEAGLGWPQLPTPKDSTRPISGRVWAVRAG